jgi:hypothetical protein
MYLGAQVERRYGGASLANRSPPAALVQELTIPQRVVNSSLFAIRDTCTPAAANVTSCSALSGVLGQPGFVRD